jgi:hypothetical protein
MITQICHSSYNKCLCACTLVVGLFFLSPTVVNAQSSAATLSPDLQEIVKLAQAHMSDDTILLYIKQSNKVYNLSANDILCLNGLGVSQQIILAMVQSKQVQPANPIPVSPQIAAPPPNDPAVPVVSPAGGSTAPPSDAVNFEYFKEELKNDGDWRDVSTNGACWVPWLLQTNPTWRPYVDNGNWTYTEDGWFWKSDYPWGEIVFHYGRWFNDMTVRWAWAPGYDWGPAWVAWRDSAPASPMAPVTVADPGTVGWAPLPPAAQFETGVGLEYNGTVVGPGVNVDFGLQPSAFVFVDAGRILVPEVQAAVIFDPVRLQYIYARSPVVNNYRVSNGTFVMDGLGVWRMRYLSAHGVRPERVALRNAIIAKARQAQEAHFSETHDRYLKTGEPISPGAYRKPVPPQQPPHQPPQQPPHQPPHQPPQQPPHQPPQQPPHQPPQQPPHQPPQQPPHQLQPKATSNGGTHDNGNQKQN